jgi:hypothetical protein
MARHLAFIRGRSPVRPPRRPQRSQAADFLTAYLRDGPRTSRDIWAAAKEHGHATATLRRAAREHEIRFRQVHTDTERATYWLLPNQEIPPIDGEPEEAAEFRRYLAELEKQYPPQCPLDDGDGDL